MIIQWSEEDSVFVVTLPEFDHCKTHGSTYEEAVKNAEEVLKLLVETYATEGKELPSPQYAFV
jgi:predicted RNase H-like HicB family nuclease